MVKYWLFFAYDLLVAVFGKRRYFPQAGQAPTEYHGMPTSMD
jgi:hypothetical protein